MARDGGTNDIRDVDYQQSGVDRLSEAAQQAFPNEVLARGEIMRRFSLSGIAAVKAAGDAERKRLQREYQATMTAVRPGDGKLEP